MPMQSRTPTCRYGHVNDHRVSAREPLASTGFGNHSGNRTGLSLELAFDRGNLARFTLANFVFAPHTYENAREVLSKCKI